MYGGCVSAAYELSASCETLEAVDQDCRGFWRSVQPTGCRSLCLAGEEWENQ